MRTSWQNWECSARRREGSCRDYINVYKTWKESVNKMEPGSFQRYPVTGWEEISPNWRTGGSLWTSENTFLFSCKVHWAQEQAPWRRGRVSSLRDSLILYMVQGYWWATQTGELDQMTSRGHFQPQPLWYSIYRYISQESICRFVVNKAQCKKVALAHARGCLWGKDCFQLIFGCRCPRKLLRN